LKLAEKKKKKMKKKMRIIKRNNDSIHHSGRGEKTSNSVLQLSFPKNKKNAIQNIYNTMIMYMQS
jgi:hypothetical protein